MGATPRTVSSLVIAVISVHLNSLMRLRSIYQSLVQKIAITVRVPAQVQINDLFAEWISQQTARLELDAPHRAETGDIGRLKTRSAFGSMVPLDAVMTLRNDSGPWRAVRYNLYPSVEVQGDTAPGYSSGQSLATMERLAAKILPQGFATEWTELAFQQKQAGNTGIVVFELSVVFIFLLLAANYESLVLPLAVILIVPMCLLAAML